MEHCLNIMNSSPRSSLFFYSIFHARPQACVASPDCFARQSIKRAIRHLDAIQPISKRRRPKARKPNAIARLILRCAPFMVETAARPICISAMVLLCFAPDAIG
jgi:hypothetical protein